MSTSSSSRGSFTCKLLSATNRLATLAAAVAVVFLFATLLYSWRHPPSMTLWAGLSVDDPLLPVPFLLALIVGLMTAVVTDASLARRQIVSYSRDLTKEWRQSEMVSHHTVPITHQRD